MKYRRVSLSTCTWTATSCCLFISLMWWATPVMADRASCGSNAQKDQSQYWEELFKAWIALVQLSHWYNSNFSQAIKRICSSKEEELLLNSWEGESVVLISDFHTYRYYIITFRIIFFVKMLLNILRNESAQI